MLRALVAATLSAHGAARSQERPEKPEKPKLTLAVGGKTTLYYLPLTIAEHLGFFAEEGLEVELQDHAGGGLALQSLLHGRADVGAGGFEHTILLRQRGLTCRAFALLGRAPQLVFGVGTRALPDFREVSQLRGRRVGISAPDSSTHWFARMVLARAGVAAADVEYVGIGTSTAAAAALREGRIDALASVDPVISLLEFRGEIRVVADTRSPRGTQELFGGPMPGGCVFAPQAFVVRYPQTVQAIANATVRALKWLQTAGPSDIVRGVPEAYMYGDRAIYLASLEKARAAFSPDGVVSEEAVTTAHRVVAQYGGGFTRVQAPGATYTNDFVRRAKLKFQVS
ncbi:ABC transporter substrate-binding protein [Ottowia testudinis]|uniref:ABC transporter substrate-binding protein n=1 Tax=Ottowia testudinis TaxID=2816950 RepID=A0A975H2H7_9BURK|nr:ABC transporter substrate-binding protein [Ottowia testudinis]QTD44206.1 ABC transporter substrate-binding protein [Ottowia testudinis]